MFLRDIHERHLSWKDADDEQSNFAAKLKNLDKGKKTTEREFRRLKTRLELLISAREKVLNNFKTRLLIKNWDKIPTRQPTRELPKEPTKHKKSKSKL